MSYDRIIRDALRLARAPRRFALGGEADPKDISPSISNPVSVFPKPQRMFPSDAPVPGGQYLGMPDKQDMTGHKSAVASIGVHPGGKPYFNASRDAVDQTGTAGKAKTKTNLFKQKAGWSWQTAPEGHEDTNTIVSVEHRGKHYYTLNAHFPKGVDFARYAESRSEPRLRPTTTGDVFLGPQAGTISVRGKEHPVYHHVVVKADGGAVGYASGGEAKKSSSREENFRNWFGNSKAIDGEGKPWVHYHATSRHFSEFIPGGHDPSLSGPAIWLTPHKHSQPAAHNIMRRGEFREGANVMPLYVKIENPLYVTNSDKEGKEELRKEFGAKSDGWPMTLHPDDVKKMKDAGYDGIFHINDYSDVKFNPETGEGLETIVFDPSQLKSAIGNSGEFNPKSNDITKSHGGMAGYASGGDVDQPRNLDDMGFYSSAAESARSLPQSKGTPQQMLATMKGVKPAELEWSGVQDKFAGQKSVTKDDLAQHFEQNVPEIKETVLGGKIDPEILKRRNEIKNIYSGKINEYLSIAYDSAESPESREEALVKAEEIQDKMWDHMDREATLPNLESTKYPDYTVGGIHKDGSPSQRNYREVLLRLPGERKFQSSHWDPANIVAHLRMQDRGPNNNILHLEELQSDWAQQGRDKGFYTKDMEEKRKSALNEFRNYSKYLADKYGLNPQVNFEMYFKLKNMTNDEVNKYKNLYRESFKMAGLHKNYIQQSPYVTNTDHWVELGLKRALLEAARGGYDKLVWTPGEEQAKRYDLSTHIDRVEYNPYNKKFNAYRDGNKVIVKSGVEQDEIKSYIGSELAKKLNDKVKNQMAEDSDLVARINSLITKDTNVEMLYDGLSSRYGLEGLDLRVGGEGMKSFYDKMLPSALRRVLKPHTDKIQPTSHVVKGNDGEDVTLPGIEITPELRESILKRGFSYYARGGEVRQHFEVGGGAAGGDSDSSGGGFGDSGSGGDSAPEATQESPAFSTDAPTDYSPPESDPSMLGGATGMAFSSPGSGSLGVGTGNTSGSFLGTAEQQLNTGPGIVGFIGGTPLGLVALGAEKLNEAARAQGYDVVDPGGARPGRGTEQAAREQAAYEAGFPGNRSGGNDSGMIPDPLAPEPSFYGFRLSNDDEETQAGMVKPVGFAPPPAPMMAEGGAVPMASGGETGDTKSMPQLTSEQQSLLDQLSRAIDRVYPAMDAAEARQPVIRHEPTMPGEPALTREQHQEYNIGQLQNALARVPTDYPTGPIGYAEGGDVGDNPAVQKALAVTSGVPATSGAAANFIQNTSNPKRIMVPATGPGGIKGIVIPRHMWEGGNGKHGLIPGLRDINQARAAVYGSQNRDPLTIGKVAEIHKQTLDEHFKRPVDEQIARENEALERLRAAKHIGKSADTLDESEKLDTVRHEYDDQGRPHVGYGSKGIAGYALYSSGHGPNQKFHVLNVCPGSVAGCSGGIDANGIADTSRGTCFAPVAESQYPGAAIRRACHTQAKFDPAMTSDWILAHTGSLRRAAEKADKNGERVLFRPNVVDESDRSSRYAIKHLNDQRKAYSESTGLKVPLPDIIANSYGKTTELHDPDNGFFVTYSNTGPKTKLGYSVAENIQRDKQRVRSTILAQDAAGRDFVNDDGEETPPKGSYMVTDVKRDSPLDEKMRKAFKYAKYWSAGRPVSGLSKDEIAEGEEAHYDGKGKPTTPEKAHYGHITLNGKRYDYQKQHILHRRLVQVGKNKDGSPHMIPTDSRFKDEEFLPKTRYMTRSGKPAGHILITTPTTSTSNAGHQTAFTHHVNESHIEHASKNKGEYEIDPPAAQEASAGKEYVPPKDVGHFAYGGTVDDEIGEHLMAFPERSHYAQIHNVHRSRHNDEKEIGSKRSHGIKSIDRALRLTSQYNQPTRGRP